MALSVSAVRWGTVGTFAYDFIAQQYGMNSSPNMLDIHNNNLSWGSPQPYFIAGFFFPQQLFQLAWLYRLWKLNPRKSEAERKEFEIASSVALPYMIGNICIGTWMFFWNSEHLKIANIFVLINTFTQLYWVVAKLPKMNTKSTSSVLAHVIAKTFLGIGVLDVIHNGSVAYFKDQPATLLVKAVLGVGFGLGAACSDWIVGGCLVYDLIALAIGQSGSYRLLLAAYAVGTAAIVAAKNLAKPPYTSEVEYSELSPDIVVNGR